MENHLWQPHSNTCFRQVWSSDAKIGEQVCDEKPNIYVVSGNLLTRYLALYKGNENDFAVKKLGRPQPEPSDQG